MEDQSARLKLDLRKRHTEKKTAGGIRTMIATTMQKYTRFSNSHQSYAEQEFEHSATVAQFRCDLVIYC